jgi:hypothetical protein
VWLLSGSAVWTVSGPGTGSAERLLRPGTIALSRPGLSESYAWDQRRHSTHAFVHFDLGPAAARRLGPADAWPLVREGASHPVLAGLCDHLVALAGADDPAALTRSMELLSMLVDLFVKGPLPERRTAVGSSVVAAALAHVRDKWARHGLVIVSMVELAGAAGVSAGHLVAGVPRAVPHRSGRSSGARPAVLCCDDAATHSSTLDEVGRACGVRGRLPLLAALLARLRGAARPVPPRRSRPSTRTAHRAGSAPCGLPLWDQGEDSTSWRRLRSWRAPRPEGDDAGIATTGGDHHEHARPSRPRK